MVTVTAVFNLIAVAETGFCDPASEFSAVFAFREHPEKAAEDSSRDAANMEKVQRFIIFFIDI